MLFRSVGMDVDMLWLSRVVVVVVVMGCGCHITIVDAVDVVVDVVRGHVVLLVC